jgi:hypothetical protein
MADDNPVKARADDVEDPGDVLASDVPPSVDVPPPLVPDESPDAVDAPPADEFELVFEVTEDVVVVVDEDASVVEVVEVVLDVEPVAVVVEVVVLDDAVKVTVTARPGKFTLSVVSSAVYVTDSGLVSDTVNDAVPVSSVVALTAVTVELPPEGVRVTVLPSTGSPFWSKSRTVMVAVEEPSAGTLVELVSTSLN